MPERKARQALPAEVLVKPAPVPVRRKLVIEYPDSDGEPMADNGYQGRAILDTVTGLNMFFRGRKDVLVAFNIFVYYVEDDPSKCVTPDVFVTKGVPGGIRFTYRIWEEGRPPDFVLEVASPSTVDIDEKIKPDLYARIGVKEYFQFDPLPHKTLLPARLRGRYLRSGSYEDLPLTHWRGGAISIRSRELGVDLHFDGERLRVWDPVPGRFLTTEDAETRADIETLARSQAEERAVAAEEQAARAKAQQEGDRELIRQLREQLAASGGSGGTPT